MRIFLVETDDDIAACYPVMAELRPHLAREAFVSQVQRQHVESGYALVALADPEIVAVAGIRIAEWLPTGRCLEIEDLVTKDGVRSKGYGAALFDWIVEHARRERCNELKLVSNVTRFDAHRFYLNRGMSILAHFFSMPL
jgi:GNAT superfamily N-acetyltransferase